MCRKNPCQCRPDCCACCLTVSFRLSFALTSLLISGCFLVAGGLLGVEASSFVGVVAHGGFIPLQVVLVVSSLGALIVECFPKDVRQGIDPLSLVGLH